MEPLKPCPFCGNPKPHIIGDIELVPYAIYCSKCKMTLSAWAEKVKEAVGIEGKENLLSGIIDYVKDHCAWIHSEKERLIYALDCLTDKSYMKWDDFWKTTERR